MDVGVWLRSRGLGQYEATFRDNEVDGAVLPKLTVEDLKDLGIAIVGHRRKIMSAIEELNAESVAELLRYVTAKISHRRRSLVEIGVDQVAPVLRVELCGQARRADEVAEHHRDRPTLGRKLETRWRSGFGGARGNAW